MLTNTNSDVYLSSPRWASFEGENLQETPIIDNRQLFSWRTPQAIPWSIYFDDGFKTNPGDFD